MMKLLLNALIKFIFGIVLLGLLLFLPAGTLIYPQAWLFMGILFIPMLIMGIVMFIKSPALCGVQEKGEIQAYSIRVVIKL